MFRAGWSPVGGGNSGHVEMAVSLIFTRLLEVISSQAAGNGRSPGQPPLPVVQCHFHGYEGVPTRLDVADASFAGRYHRQLKLL